MRTRPARTLLISILTALTAATATAQSFRIERIASGLNQPTYVTQAPGDPANILYITERTRDANPGFNTSNQMGKVLRYDVITRTSQVVLDLEDRPVIQDTGLVGVAFHPDFNNEGTFGHNRMYVTLAEAGASVARNKVEEYIIGPSGTATFERLLLQYDNDRGNNHTINWAEFDPTATGDARNYLYISTGEVGFCAERPFGWRPSP